MQKTIQHNGKEFILDLTLNNKIERGLNGKRLHLLAAREKDDQNMVNIFVQSWDIDSEKMKEQILSAEEELRLYAEKITTMATKEEEIAVSLGYK